MPRWKTRKQQHLRIEAQLKPLERDAVLHDIFNVVIELRVNADNLDGILKKLREENDG